MSLERRTPLRRDTEKSRAWASKARRPIKARKGLRAKTKRRTPEEIQVREEVFARDRYRCLLADRGRVLGTACAFDLTYHHLLKESHGGEYTIENGVTLCQVHNDAVEDHPADALELGLVVRPGIGHAEAAQRRKDHSVIPR